uniref:Uncharacterized protein n=1 Tax=Rhizophora mucronata TaxID=61149 RepID=A0A2P2IP00_RHIMU
MMSNLNLIRSFYFFEASERTKLGMPSRLSSRIIFFFPGACFLFAVLCVRACLVSENPARRGK